MDTVKFYNDLDITNIQTYLSKCDKPFETSPLYSSETEETYVDTERRLSVYRTIVDPKLFDLVEDLMTVINQGDNEYQYVLWKNGSDITHIKYEEGWVCTHSVSGLHINIWSYHVNICFIPLQWIFEFVNICLILKCCMTWWSIGSIESKGMVCHSYIWSLCHIYV